MSRDLRLVVFLRGVNVGGHRTFRPSKLAAELKHLGCINIGAAGTFVFNKKVPLTRLRAELKRRLPFDTVVAVCHGENITRLVENPPFDQPARANVVRFLTILSKHTARVAPGQLPEDGQWFVRVISRQKRFVVGEYRRHMKTIGYLGKLDRHFGVPVTTRNWNTIQLIAKVLAQ
jgi:uncharacterized protein (DUF1697 family)